MLEREALLRVAANTFLIEAALQCEEREAA